MKLILNIIRRRVEAMSEEIKENVEIKDDEDTSTCKKEKKIP